MNKLSRIGFGFMFFAGRRDWLATMAAGMGLLMANAVPWLKYIRVVKPKKDDG